MRPAHRLTTCAATALGLLALLALPGAAAAKDGNHDRIPDRWEKHHHLSLSVNQARHDQDRDHLRNRAEFLAGDNPRDRDSDDDGVIDGNENAGTIASFDAASGKLTITLFGGETISGLVSDETEIECGEGGATISDSHQGEDGGPEQQAEPGDDDGEEPGDDGGDDGEESGDDNGGDNSGPGGPGGGAACTTADLVAGATVDEAELHLGNGTATFEKVELGS